LGVGVGVRANLVAVRVHRHGRNILHSAKGHCVSFLHRHKAKRTAIDGISFPSRTEAELYSYLRLLEKGGQIRSLEMQSKVEPDVCTSCGVRAAPSVKVDFFFEERFTRLAGGDDWRPVWAEAKGLATDRWKAFLAWWRHSGPGVLRIYNFNKRLKLIEEVRP
jgi:hypothetical protein